MLFWTWLLACSPEPAPDTDTAAGDSDVDTSDSPPCQETDWFHDADADGFGANDGRQQACEAPGADWVQVGGDCDDTNPNLRPGQTEVCNSMDDDCDPATSEAGTVAYLDVDGRFTDLTATFAAGRPDAPVAFETTGYNGTLRFCEGTFYANVLFNADVTVEGAGADRTTLHGGGRERVLRRGHQYQTFTVRDLRLSGGALAGDLGGGLYFSSGNTVTLERLIVEGNAAGRGGGLGVSSSTVVVRDTVFRANTASERGAAIALEGASSGYGPSSLILERVTFEGHGGAGGVIHVGTDTSVTASEVVFADNVGDAVVTASGGTLAATASFSCTGAGC